MYLLTVVLPLRRRNHHYLGGSSSVQVSSVLSQLTRIRQVVVVKVELGNNLFYNAESLYIGLFAVQCTRDPNYPRD